MELVIEARAFFRENALHLTVVHLEHNVKAVRGVVEVVHTELVGNVAQHLVLPAHEDPPRTIICGPLDEIRRTVLVIAVARMVHGKAHLVSEWLDRVVRANALAV